PPSWLIQARRPPAQVIRSGRWRWIVPSNCATNTSASCRRRHRSGDRYLKPRPPPDRPGAGRPAPAGQATSNDLESATDLGNQALTWEDRWAMEGLNRWPPPCLRGGRALRTNSAAAVPGAVARYHRASPGYPGCAHALRAAVEPAAGPDPARAW